MLLQRVGLLALCLCLTYGCGENATDTKTSEANSTKQTASASDAQAPTAAQGFAEAAASGDIYEVESSRLATTKAISPEVRQFAQMMISDHSATTEQLKQIASKATPAIELPMTPNSRQQLLLGELMGLDGAEFDRRFIAQQADAHREAVMLMEGFSERGDHEDLRQFAAATAPKIRMHLQMVEQLSSKSAEKK